MDLLQQMIKYPENGSVLTLNKYLFGYTSHSFSFETNTSGLNGKVSFVFVVKDTTTNQERELNISADIAISFEDGKLAIKITNNSLVNAIKQTQFIDSSFIINIVKFFIFQFCFTHLNHYADKKEFSLTPEFTAAIIGKNDKGTIVNIELLQVDPSDYHMLMEVDRDTFNVTLDAQQNAEMTITLFTIMLEFALTHISRNFSEYLKNSGKDHEEG